MLKCMYCGTSTARGKRPFKDQQSLKDHERVCIRKYEQDYVNKKKPSAVVVSRIACDYCGRTNDYTGKPFDAVTVADHEEECPMMHQYMLMTYGVEFDDWDERYSKWDSYTPSRSTAKEEEATPEMSFLPNSDDPYVVAGKVPPELLYNK